MFRLFAKRETVFLEKNKPLWKEAKKAIKAAGIKGMWSESFETDMPTCGCGAKLDIRNFGANGKIDRATYRISVYADDAEKVRAIIENIRYGAPHA